MITTPKAPQWVKIQSRDVQVHVQSLYSLGQKRTFFKNMGIDFEVTNHLALSSGELYFDQAELDAAQNLLINKYEELPDFIREITDTFLDLLDDYERFCTNARKIRTKQLTREELLVLYDQFTNHFCNLVPYSFIISIVFERVAKTLIEPYLDEQGKKKGLLHAINEGTRLEDTTPTYIARLFPLVQEHMELRTERKKIMLKGLEQMNNCFKQIALLVGIQNKELRFVASWEIEEALRTRTLLKNTVILDRKKGFTVSKVHSVIQIRNEIPVLPNNKAATVLHGTSLCTGHAHGQVRIIRTRTDLASLKKHDIMVVSHVEVWMYSAFSRSAAIITESGGILSHAAIYARELRRPCISDIAQATKIFHTGDHVDVDANTATVTRLDS